MTTAFKTLTLDEGREALRFCNSFNRLDTVTSLAWSMESHDWLTLLGENWSTCDNIADCADELEETPLGLLAPGSPDRFRLMDETELAAFERLPDEVVIWRGCYASNKWGLSWSLDREIAAKFPTLHRYRQAGQPLLVKARIAKDQILALKLDRNEQEILTWWERPRHVSTSHLRGQNA